MTEKKRKIITFAVFACVIILLLVATILVDANAKHESVKETMRDAVLHSNNRVNLFGLSVSPSVISAFLVTAILFVFALLVRIFVIPRFKIVPGKFQMLLEELVGLFDKLAKNNSPHKNNFLGAYVFVAGVYIFTSTIFELFGIQWITVEGNSVTLPAPLSDVNAAISLGCLSYLFIMVGGISVNGIKGLGKTLKDFSLPISMSFRLFGALLSGALVTELVYYYVSLSYVIPIVVAVLFTLLHAFIQAYVLTMLTTLFYGEVTEPHIKKIKQKKTGGKN